MTIHFHSRAVKYEQKVKDFTLKISPRMSSLRCRLAYYRTFLRNEGLVLFVNYFWASLAMFRNRETILYDHL